MGNTMTCHPHMRSSRFFHRRKRRSRCECADFDFRGPEELQRASSVHEEEEEEVGLDPTTIPAWMEESLGMDVETWLRIRDSVSLRRLRARLKGSLKGLSPERLKAQVIDEG